MTNPRFGKMHTTESFHSGELKSVHKVMEVSTAIKSAGELLRELTNAAQQVVDDQVPNITLEIYRDRTPGGFIRLVKKCQVE